MLDIQLYIHGSLCLLTCPPLYLCLTFPTQAKLKHLGLPEPSTPSLLYLGHETHPTSNFLLPWLTSTHSPRLDPVVSVLSDFLLKVWSVHQQRPQHLLGAC